MNKGFWEKLKKPIMTLAPMADVTDAAFRRIIASSSAGGPDVMWTEFVSADGLALAPKEGRQKLLKDLEYSEGERPIVAQFFTSNPEHMREASKLAVELGFDGVDINMGCPDRSIEKQGAGAGLIKDPKLASELIRAAKEGAESASRRIPVSVKTRLGYNKVDLDWIRALLEEKLPALIIHMRTRKEMSKVSAHWDLMPEIIKMRDEISPDTLIIGNGDVKDLEDAKKKVKESGCDGVMFGRAIFGNPWLFSQHEPSIRERLEVLIEHAKLFEELLPHKSFAIMKKHFKAYLSGKALATSDAKDFDARPTGRSFGRGAGELRTRLMDANDSSQVEQIIREFLDVYKSA